MRAPLTLVIPLVLATVPVATAWAAPQPAPLQLAGFFGNLFDHRMAHFRDLIESRQYDEAETFYIGNRESLDQSEGIRPALATLVARLNEHYAAGADDLGTQLSAVQAAPAAATWPYIATGLQQAHALLDKYSQHALLQNPAYRAPAITALGAAVDHANQVLLDGAADAFAAYDHSSADFFGKYPLALSPLAQQKLTEEGADKWLPLVSSLPREAALALVRAYGPLLQGDTARGQLAQAWVKGLVGWNGWKEPLEIDKAWGLGAELAAVGIDPKYAPVKRTVLVLSGATPGPIPAGWDADPDAFGVPYLVSSAAELDAQLAQLDAADIHYLAVIDPSRVSTVSMLGKPEQVSGTRITGSREDSNPAYARARQAVEDATTDYNTALQQENAAASQPSTPNDGSTLGVLGSALLTAVSKSSAASSTSDAQGRLEQARAALAATPATVTRNLTEPYSYTKVGLEQVTEQQIGIYFLDTRNKLLFRSRLDDTETQTDEIYTGVDLRDPDKDRLAEKSRTAQAHLQQPQAASLKGAADLVPDILGGAVKGSRRQAAELVQLVEDDDAIFQHHGEEKLQHAAARNAEIARALALDIGAPAAAPADGADRVALMAPLPESAGCGELLAVRHSAELPAMWKSALQKVARVDGNTAQSSYVFLEARDDVSNLREEIAHAATLDDAAKAAQAALDSLRTGAGKLDAALTLPAPAAEAGSGSGLDGYLQLRMMSGATDMVARAAAAIRPDAVAQLYRIYHTAFNTRGAVTSATRQAYFDGIDAALEQLGRQLSAGDAALVGALNTVSSDRALDEVNNSIDARCAPPPAPSSPAPMILTGPVSPGTIAATNPPGPTPPAGVVPTAKTDTLPASAAATAPAAPAPQTAVAVPVAASTAAVASPPAHSGL